MDGFDQHAVATGLNDGAMESPVTRQGRHFVLGVLLHGLNGLPNGGEIAPLGQGSGERGGFSLDHAAGPNEFERPPLGRCLGGQWRADRGGACHGINARAAAHLNPALYFKGNQGLAYRGPAYAELAGQVALGRQSLMGCKLSRANQQAHLLGNLAVESLRFDT